MSCQNPRTWLTGLLSALLLLGLTGPSSSADEGFWTFDRPPIVELAQRHGLKTNVAWFDRIERASVKVSRNAGSGVVVSENGLVQLARHQVEPWIRELGFVGSTILRDGFLAGRPEREVKLSGLTVELFDSWKDVTALITGVGKDKNPAEAAARRRGAIRNLVEDEGTRTGLLCRVEERDGGARYVLVRYRVHRDLRLVFCPETDVARFGGTFDNFNFPRWSFDVAMIRIWAGGKPLVTDHCLRLTESVPDDGDVVVSAGFPSKTRRGTPWPVLEHHRTKELAVVSQVLAAMETVLAGFLKSCPDHTDALNRYLSVSNASKAVSGYRSALANDRMTGAFIQRETGALDSDSPESGVLAETIGKLKGVLKDGWSGDQRRLLSRLESRYASRARSLLRLAEELEKKPEERSDRFRGQNLENLRAFLARPPRSDRALESTVASCRVDVAAELLGADDPFVAACRQAADGQGAGKAIALTVLADPEACGELVEGAPQSIFESDDPLICLVRRLDVVWKELWGEEREIYRQARRQLEQDYSRLLEQLVPSEAARQNPDARPNGTPRLTIGKVAGYSNGVTRVPSRTSLWGLMARQHAMKAVVPFRLPPRWTLARESLDLDTNMVLACTLDVVENCSGSSVVDSEGRLAGIVFDCNFEGLANTYVCDSERGRALVVSSAIVLEALEKVYRADELVRELRGRR